jgi:hypothetical protein
VLSVLVTVAYVNSYGGVIHGRQADEIRRHHFLNPENTIRFKLPWHSRGDERAVRLQTILELVRRQGEQAIKIFRNI